MDSSPTGDDRQRLVLRPVRWSIIPGAAITVFGLVFAMAGFSHPSDVGNLVVMVICGLVFAYLGFSLVTASATVTSQGIRYRNGVVMRRIATGDIASVEVGRGDGAGYSRIDLIVNRRSGKAVRLTALQRADTAKGRREFGERALQVAAILGLG